MTITQVSKEAREVFHTNSRKKVYRPIVAPTIGHYQIDLLDCGNSFNNKKVRYLLCMVDIFSRKAGVVGIVRKTPPMVLKAFKHILEEYFNGIVFSVACDEGSEFKGVFAKWLSDEGVNQKTSNSHVNKNKMGIVERFNGTISNLIALYKYDNNTTKFIDALPDLVESYNEHIHSTVGETPNSIFDGSKLPRIKEREEVKDIKIGSLCRIRLKRATFAKGNIPRYSEKVYEVIGKTGGIYKIEDEDGEIKYVLYEKLRVVG